MESGTVRMGDGADIYYAIDDFTDGWATPETIVCIHGLAESTEAWRSWVPHLSRDFRVVRFDLRGFGRSTPMPADHSWTIDRIMADLDELLGHLGLEEVNLVGCKSGGTIALGFAGWQPDRVRALAVFGSHPTGPEETWLPFINEHGVRHWLEETMPRRLAALSPVARQWWIELMAQTPLSTLQGYLQWFPSVDLTAELGLITAPTLIVKGGNIPNRAGSGKAGWHSAIASAMLKALPVESSHIGGAYPDMCARIALDFMKDPNGYIAALPDSREPVVVQQLQDGDGA